MKTIFEQHLENLPKEILCLMRFFPATILPDGKKKPLIDKWNDPKFQSFAGDAYQHAKAKCSVTPPFAAFDTSGHGKGTDYALIDLDNVRDAKTGEITNPDAEKWLNYFKSEFEGCYCELSQSQSGFHFLCRPTVGKFDVIKNTKRAGGVLVFDKEKGAQLEISYKMDAKSCHLTGNLFECLAVGVQLIELGLIDFGRVLVALDFGLEVIDLLLVTVDAHVVVLAEEQQHHDKGNKDDEWHIEPSRYPFGSLKLHSWEYWDYWDYWDF